MKWYGFIFMVIAFTGAINTIYQIFKMTTQDAKARGLKHPTFWGIFATSGQSCEGLLLYLVGRRKYPSSMSEDGIREIESRKKKIMVGIIFLAGGAIGLLSCIIPL